MRWIEAVVGTGLVLGPLAYALTLQPEVVETVELVEVERQAAPQVIPEVTVIPVAAEPAIAVAPEEPTEVEPSDRIEFAFVNEAGIVLSTDADVAWGKGRLRGNAGPGQYRAAKKADGATVPASLWAQRGRTFDLYGADGKVCTARLGDISVLAQHNGPDLYDLFDNNSSVLDYEEFENRTISRKEIRAEVWSIAQEGGSWLVAEVISDDACTGALWARDSSLPAPTVLRLSDNPSPETERRLALHEASAELADTQAEYEKWYADVAPEDRDYHDSWSTIVSRSPATVQGWVDADGVVRMVELRFGEEGEFCGDGFDTRISALEHVTAEGFEDTAQSVEAEAVFDADGDGRYEFLYFGFDSGANLDSETLGDGWEIDQAFMCPC